MGILDRFLSILNSKDQDIGGFSPIKSYQGRDLTPSVTDKKLHAPTKEEIARSEAEKDAITGPTIGPISIDPTDYLTPGAFAKVGATLKAAATSVTATPVMVAAFRSANNTMLSRKVITDLDSITAFAKKPGVLEQSKEDGREILLDTLIFNKLSTKELSKYGTPEFLLDRWLKSTNTDPSAPGRVLQKVDSKSILRTPEASLVRGGNQDLIYARDTIQSYKDRGIEIPSSLLREEELAKSMILRQGRIFEDLNLANRTGKTLLHNRQNEFLREDITEGVLALQRDINRHDINPNDLLGKSLQQITSMVHNKNEEAVKIMKKSLEHKNQIISKRTGELLNSQRDPDAGMFVRLESPKDLAQETDVLNHCIGAVGRDNDKYIPAFDTVTGKANKGVEVGNTSFAQYKKGLETGTSEFYSYRPKGLPEFTIEVGVAGDQKRLVQAYGFEDASLNGKQKAELTKFLDNKGINYDDRFSGIIDDAGGNDWIPE